MTTTARVTDITRTRKHGTDMLPMDIIKLIWNGKVYYWDSEPGRYEVGQDVPVNPPTATDGPIMPVSGGEGINYAGAVSPEATR